ncbi:S1 family peptidase [Roseinatronobacter thiooxidans]|uniref:S1 family peptidase n=1 Tax=Roseinatronobacter thiooxidans TaxID=121821 RepID=UPI0008F8CBCE|nr:serine protease [Roseinatronobacter thiooxidans]
MIKTLVSSLSILLTSFWLSSAASAQGFFPDGACTIVVASRQSLPEARALIITNQWSDDARVFESRNGWFAITTTVVDVSSAPAVLASGKQAGIFPEDAYCSTGQMYLRQIEWRENSQHATSQSSRLWNEFDARPFSLVEKRFLQAALALEGHYTGLIDGAWGRGSQSAIERFTRQKFDRVPLNADAAYLVMTTIDTFIADGWEAKNINYLALSVMMPMKKMRLVEREGLLEKWEHTGQDMTLMFTDLTDPELLDLHSNLWGAEGLVGEPYTVRQSNRWVTAVDFLDGSGYIRSDLIGGTWSTVALFGSNASRQEFGLITSSIVVGSPVAMLPETDGLLLAYTTDLISFLAEDDHSPQSIDRADRVATPDLNRRESPSEAQGRTSGTGFFVNSDGEMLTNAHVIEGCSDITVDGKPADIIAVSRAFDLAAVKPRISQEVAHLPFAAREIGLNADITIAGYPLHGLLGGLNVSRGSISAMKGLRGDETSFQMSAPVQPGNSGGPVVDRSGNVVGVVVSKLDVMEVASVTGDIAQNVNFAVRGSMAKIFMQTNGIQYEERVSNEEVRPEEAAKKLEATTRLIECLPY